MKISSLTPKASTSSSGAGLLDKFFRRSVFKLLSRLQIGRLTIVEGGQYFDFGESISDTDLHPKIVVSDPGFYRLIVTRGSIGAGEAFMLDYWQTTDLVDVVRLMCRNMDQVDRMERGSAAAGMLIQKFKHFLASNTVSGSKKNIHAHYDLSNELFEYFLDSKMMYSSAIFPTSTVDLESIANSF